MSAAAAAASPSSGFVDPSRRRRPSLTPSEHRMNSSVMSDVSVSIPRSVAAAPGQVAQCRHIYVYRNADQNHKGVRIPVFGKTLPQILKTATKACSGLKFFPVRKLFMRMSAVSKAGNLRECERYVATESIDDIAKLGLMPHYLTACNMNCKKNEPTPISLATPKSEQ